MKQVALVLSIIACIFSIYNYIRVQKQIKESNTRIKEAELEFKQNRIRKYEKNYSSSIQ